MENSILTLLTALHGSLADNETYRLDITKNGTSLDMIVIPLLKDGNKSIPEEAQATRAALSLPLAMTGMDIDELATEFSDRVQGFGYARQSASESYQELLATLNDATASTKNATATSKDKTAKTPDKVVKKAKAETETTEKAEQKSEPVIKSDDTPQKIEPETVVTPEKEETKAPVSVGLFNF